MDPEDVEQFLHKCLAKALSQEGPKAAGRALADWLIANGIKVVAVDFDLTMINVHSGGHIDPTNDTRGVLGSLSKEFDEFAAYCQESGLRIACVTFSDARTIRCASPSGRKYRIGGKELVHRVLKSSNAKFTLEKIFAYWPKNYTLAHEYEPLGLNGPMPESKSFHLAKLRREMGVTPKEIVLIDDDMHNCVCAVREGHMALSVYPPNGFTCKSLTAAF